MNKPKKKVRIGDSLVALGFLTEDQLVAALTEQKSCGKKIGQVVIDLGFMSEELFLTVQADQLGIPYIHLKNKKVDDSVTKLIPEGMARRYRAIPLGRDEQSVLVAMSDPTDILGMDELQQIVGEEVSWAVAKEDEIVKLIDRVFLDRDELFSLASELESELGYDTELESDSASAGGEIGDAPIVKFISSIFEEAIALGASDIHIEPDEKIIRVRLRVDGVLQERVIKEKAISDAIVMRLKIISELDISEKRLPQDGRFKMSIKTKNIDVRISTLPTQYGESVVMRILDQSSSNLDLKKIGMPPALLKKFDLMIRRPHGLILVTGPTGSGKTTTLYSALNALNAPDKKIITVEDPVEYRLQRIQQVQVSEKVGLTFGGVLRSALRQDPDIVLVGEIRDKGTAEIALKAAMTGHLVLSTLHTNDSVSSAIRLVDMGVPAYMVATSVIAVIAQRLIRRNCRNCIAEYPLTDSERNWVNVIADNRLPNIDQVNFRKSKGCASCHGSGYSGRLGVYEMMEMSDEGIYCLRKNNVADFAKIAYADPNYESLALAGLRYAMKGVTSVAEVFRLASMLDSNG